MGVWLAGCASGTSVPDAGTPAGDAGADAIVDPLIDAAPAIDVAPPDRAPEPDVAVDVGSDATDGAAMGSDGAIDGSDAADGAIDGASDAGGALAASPLDFHCVGVGVLSRLVPISVMNRDVVPLGPVVVHVTGLDSGNLVLGTNDCAGTTLAPGASCSVELAWSPKRTGILDAALEVEAPPARTTRFPLAGRSLIGEPVSVNPMSGFYGNVKVGTVSGGMAYRIFNLGGSSGPAPSVQLSHGEAFRITRDTCTGQQLPAPGFCEVEVVFAPPHEGILTDSLIFPAPAWAECTSDGVVSLSGAGIP